MPPAIPGIFRPQRGFTLIELLAVVAVLVILVALLLPALKGIFSRAAEAKCVSNLRTISAASVLFSADHNGQWPENRTGQAVFSTDLVPYLPPIPGRQDANFRSSPLICPAIPNQGENSNYVYQGVYTPTSYTYENPKKTVKYGLGYAQNIYAADRADNSYYVKNRLAVGKSSGFMLYMDFSGHYVTSSNSLNTGKEALKKRHHNKLNIAYADGSVRPLLYDEIPSQIPRNVEPASSFWYGRVGDN